MCGTQNNELFPGGSFIYQTYVDENDSFKRTLFAGGKQGKFDINLFIGPEFSDRIFPFEISSDCES
ncbi:MAG: hypothetical protein Q4F54_05760 [Coriobacteriia bacterium]|nr:hypothetical protein [Coriobacteriia bacterium]